MKISDPESLALHVVQQLQQAGHTAYWAGGCVRDRLMGRPPKDFDVATSAHPEEVLRLFPRSQKVGVAFGVVLVRGKPSSDPAGKRPQVEVATFRADGDYSDGRHPDSVRFTNAEEDARRRDFTCNGLFFDPIAQQLHDYVGGQQDIEDKILRAIGEPRQRFTEDHLRMLRAVRFAARLGFQMHPLTRTAIDEFQQHIEGISRERIGEEVRMMLEHPTRVAAVTMLASFPQLFARVFGFPVDATAAEREWPRIAGLPLSVDRAVVLMALMRDAQVAEPGEMVPVLRTRLMLSNEETEALAFYAAKLPVLEKWEDLPKSAMKRLMADPRWRSNGGLEALYRAEPENADQLLAFNEWVETLREEGVAPPPLVTGETLIAMGAKPGPAFKGWLDRLYDQQLEGELTTREQASDAARKLIQQAAS